jgi:hypothetical protein
MSQPLLKRWLASLALPSVNSEKLRIFVDAVLQRCQHSTEPRHRLARQCINEYGVSNDRAGYFDRTGKLAFTSH